VQVSDINNFLLFISIPSGKGAWQNWSYELHVRDEAVGITLYKKNVNATSYTIQNLEANTEYVIKAAAYTSSGRGPWSSEFRGKTLKIPQDGKYASILWSAADGLLKSDVTGDNVELLLQNSELKVRGANNSHTHIKVKLSLSMH
jgi:Fibronectin type III domain.